MVWQVLVLLVLAHIESESTGRQHFVFPGLAISLTLLSIVFINYGIDELADPRLRLRSSRNGVFRRLFRPRSVA